jgi:predicted DNA-binding protein
MNSQKKFGTMSTQITITLPDEVYQRAERLARLANRDIASIVADTIESSIPPISPEAAALEPVSALSDEQVLALTQLQMEPDQDARLSDLLDRQQSGILTDTERIELQTLMQIYQEGLLRKATALSEAVKRGLMEPLS